MTTKIQNLPPISLIPEEGETPISATPVHIQSTTLHELFSQDREEQAVQATASHASSAWVRFPNWIASFFSSQPAHQTPKESDNRVGISPINRVPSLEPPPELTQITKTSLEESGLHSPSNKTQRKKVMPFLSEAEMANALSQMKLSTAHEIMMVVVLSSQLELDQESVQLATDSASTLQQVKKAKSADLEKIKDLLEKDERLAGYFDTSQKLACAASFIFTAAHYILKIPGIQPYLLGLGAGGAGVALILTLMPFALGSLTFISGLGNAITKYRLGETKKEMALSTHERQRYEEKLEDSRDKIGSIVENQAMMQQLFIRYLKSQDKLCGLILSKS